MKIIVLFVVGFIGAVLAAPSALKPEDTSSSPDIQPIDVQLPSQKEQTIQTDEAATTKNDQPNLMAGISTDPETLKKSLDRMKQTLPPSMRGMLDQKIAEMGGPENLQKTINEQIEKFGGMDKLQEAVQAKLKNMRGMMGNFGNMMGGQNPFLTPQMKEGIQFQPIPHTEPTKLNLTDKEGLKHAVDDMKKRMPPMVQEIVDKHMGDFDGSLPDLSHVGIEKFPTNKEEFKDAIATVREQLPAETKDMLEKVQQIKESMSDLSQGGNPLSAILGGADGNPLQGLLGGNMQNMMQKLMGGGNPLAALMGNHGGNNMMQSLLGGGNPLAALLGQHSDDPMVLKSQMISSIIRQMKQKDMIRQQRQREQQTIQMQNMRRHQMRRPIMRPPTPPRMEVRRQRPVTVNINVNPGMVVDMHDISPAGLHALRSLYNMYPRYESQQYRPMTRGGRWHHMGMRRPMYHGRPARMTRGVEQQIINQVFHLLPML